MSIAGTAFIVFVLFSISFIIYRVFKGEWVEILPDMMWFCLMTLPFAIQWPYFVAGPRETQAAGIMIIGVALMLGDFIKITKVDPVLIDKGAQENSLINKLMNNYLVYVAVFLAIVIYHLSQISEVPLLEKYIHHANPQELDLMRENSSKLLDVPLVFKYMFTWSTSIIAPLGFLLMVKKKLYLRAFLFIILALLYARITMALLPSMYLIFTICFVAALEWGTGINKKIIIIPLAIIIIPFLVKAGTFLAAGPYSGFRYQPNPAPVAAFPAGDPRNMSTIPDNFRLVPEDKVSFMEKKINYVVYRFFLIPAEVSSKWYQFYPEISGGYIGIKDLLPGGRGQGFVHPSNLLGRWAYQEKYPHSYLDSVHAYASIDADAHTRMGMPGVLLCGLALLIIRLFIKKILVNSFIGRSLYRLLIVQLALLPVQASLPAILAAQGMLPLLLLMTIHYLTAVRQAKTPEAIAG